MDIASVAKKIREAVMNRAEDDGRVFHADSIEQEVAKILKAEYPTTNVWGHRAAMDRPYRGKGAEALTEWR